MHIYSRLKSTFISIIQWIIVLIYIIFEQLIWEIFVEPIVGIIKQFAPLKKFALWIDKRHKYMVLSIFIFLFILVEILGIYAGVSLISGQIALALILYLTKLPVATFTFWLFGISKKKLLTFTWFARIYFFIMHIIDNIKSFHVYIEAKRKIIAFKAYINTLRKHENTFLSHLNALYRKILKKEA